MDPLIKKEFDDLTILVKDIKKELKGLIEIQQRLIHERLGVAIPPFPKEYGEEAGPSSKKIEITNSTEEGRIKVSGKTYDYMTAIKEAGKALFDKPSKSWSLPISSLDSLIKNLEELNLVLDKDFSVNVIKPTNIEDNDKDDNDEGFGSGM